MSFARGMFFANYVVFALAEKPFTFLLAFALMLVWGAVAVMEWREMRHC